MDHLPRPRGIKEPLIEIPLMEYIPYDFLGFESFPLRKGFVKDGSFDDSRPYSELASFVQSWLYFGLLSEVLEIRVTPECFTAVLAANEPEKALLCSTRLTTLIDDWQKQLRDMGVQRCDEKLRHVGHTIELAIRGSSQCDFNTTRDSEQYAAVTLSVKLLVSTLVHVYNSLWPERQFSVQDARLVPLPSSTSTPSPAAWLLMRRMSQANWCPQAVRRICASYNYATACYLSQLPRLRRADHSACTDSNCLAYNTNEQVYEPKHTTAGCQCSHIAVDIERVVKVIQSGGIPLIRLKPAGLGKLDISVSASSDRKAYEVISHVWVDGLGNPKDNSLPLCQLQRLQEMTRMVATGQRLLWIDTLCVPVGDRLKAVRRMAIDSTAAIYQDAVGMSVFDAEILDATEAYAASTGANDVTNAESDLLAYVLCSVWNSRCWTYQEAVLGKRLYFNTARGFQKPPVDNLTLLTGLDLEGNGVRWLHWRFMHSPLPYLLRSLWFLLRCFPPSDAVVMGFRISCGPQAWSKCHRGLNADSRLSNGVATSIRHLVLGSSWLLGAVVFSLLTLPTSMIFTLWAWLGCLTFGLILGIASPGPKRLNTQEVLKQQLRFQLASDMAAELKPRGVNRGLELQHPELASSLRAAHFVNAWNALVCRTATRYEDLHIILTSLTTMVPFRITSLKTSAERMRAIIGSYEQVPLALLFHSKLAHERFRDPLNAWLPLAPTNDLLPSGPQEVNLHIHESEVEIRISEIEDSHVLLQCCESRPNRHPLACSDLFSTSMFTVELGQAEGGEQTIPCSSNEGVCFLIQRQAFKNLEGGTRNLRAVRLSITRQDVDVLYCSYDALVTVNVCRRENDQARDMPAERTAISAIRIPFCKLAPHYNSEL